MARRISIRTGASGEAAPGSQGSVPALWRTRADVLVYAVLIGLGVLQFVLPIRADDFFRGDTIYFEFARSILERGRYEIDFNDVTYPPGLPGILAFLCMMGGCSYRIFVQSMAVFATLGLIASYQLLRHEESRGVAAVTCLLMASSPIVFELSTRGVSSDLPYFFTSMAMLMLAARLDGARSVRARLILGLLCIVMLASSVLIRSSGMALIAGLIGWLTAGCLGRDRSAGIRRLRAFAGILLAGVVVQGAWMGWSANREAPEWPMLEGHPRSYISQLRVKSGIQPELGTATFSDVPLRVITNIPDRAAGLVSLLARKDYIHSSWLSPLVFGSVLLIALGLGGSLWSGGGSLTEWYFISYEAMYSVWPWPLEMRFLLPVVPLACLYLWRGSTVIRAVAERMPRAVGLAGVVVGVVAGARIGAEILVSSSAQLKLEAMIWIVIVVASAWMVWARSVRLPALLKRYVSSSSTVSSVPGMRLSLPQIIGGAAATGLVVLGIALQCDSGLSNLNFDLRKDPAYGRIVAAQWIARNTPTTSVLMAGQTDVVHHYSGRRVVWFPPLSNPRLLMQGIRRHKVDYVIVTSGRFYYRPSEEACFEILLKKYPEAFRLASEGTEFKIFEVLPDRISDNAVEFP